MTSPDAAVSTAEDELERLLAAVTGAHPQAVNNIRKFFAAIRASARNDALEGAAKLHDARASVCVENATRCHPAGAVYARIMETATAHLEHAKAIRALKSSAPAVQTGWQPADPDDDSVRLCGLWVTNNISRKTYWESFVACQDEDGNAVTPEGDDVGWAWSNLFTQPLPSPPPREGGGE